MRKSLPVPLVFSATLLVMLPTITEAETEALEFYYELRDACMESDPKLSPDTREYRARAIACLPLAAEAAKLLQTLGWLSSSPDLIEVTIRQMAKICVTETINRRNTGDSIQASSEKALLCTLSAVNTAETISGLYSLR